MTDGVLQEIILRKLDELKNDFVSLNGYLGQGAAGEATGDASVAQRLEDIQGRLAALEEYWEVPSGNETEGTASVGMTGQIDQMQALQEDNHDALARLGAIAEAQSLLCAGSLLLNVAILACVIVRMITGARNGRRLVEAAASAPLEAALGNHVAALRKEMSESERRVSDAVASAGCPAWFTERDWMQVRDRLELASQPKGEGGSAQPPQAQAAPPPPSMLDIVSGKVASCLSNQQYPLDRAEEVFGVLPCYPVQEMAAGIDGMVMGVTKYAQVETPHADMAAVSVDGRDYLFPNNPYKAIGKVFDHTGTIRAAACHLENNCFIIDQKGSY